MYRSDTTLSLALLMPRQDDDAHSFSLPPPINSNTTK